MESLTCWSVAYRYFASVFNHRTILRFVGLMAHRCYLAQYCAEENFSVHTRFKPFTYFSVQSCCVSAWPHSLPIHCVKFQFAESYYGSVECPEEKCCMKYKLGDTGKEQEMCQKEIFFFFMLITHSSVFTLCVFFSSIIYY